MGEGGVQGGRKGDCSLKVVVLVVVACPECKHSKGGREEGGLQLKGGSGGGGGLS